MVLSEAEWIPPGISSLQFRASGGTRLSSSVDWCNLMEIWQAATVAWGQICSAALKPVVLAPGAFQSSQVWSLRLPRLPLGGILPLTPGIKARNGTSGLPGCLAPHLPVQAVSQYWQSHNSPRERDL